MFTSLDGNITISDSPELTKQTIRNEVWKYMVQNNIGTYPLPLKNRIPNFKGAAASGHKVAELPYFTSSQTIKVNPDKPQEEVRFLTLQARKKLLVPTPQLRKGLFNLLENESGDDTKTLRRKVQSEGVKNLSKPIGLDNAIKVDLIVIGSVAVSKTGECNSGRRIGKGEGYADLEYAMMKSMKAVNDNVPVVTTVHNCQVFDDLPKQLFLPHDFPIDVIVTPTEVINITQSLDKPDRVYWNLLSVEKFKQIPILRHLYEIDKKNGMDVTLLNGAVPPSEEEINAFQHTSNKRGGRKGFEGQKGGRGAFLYPHGDGHNPIRGRGRGDWGRGRGGWRDAEMDLDRGSANRLQNISNIQVTININKNNRIVRRSVEETKQQNRVPTRNSEALTPKKVFNPTFSIFLGGIPKKARFHELRTELGKHNVNPSDIGWKGANGFAFLNFQSDPNEADLIIESLAGLSLKGKPLKVERAVTEREQGGKPSATLPPPAPTQDDTPQEYPKTTRAEEAKQTAALD